MKMKLITRPFEVKSISDDGTVEGYASVFHNMDAYRDIVLPGAFQKTLAAHKAAGSMPAMLWQHQSYLPIGVWDEMDEDSKGLRSVGRLCLDVAKGREARALLKMKAVRGLSIGFAVPDGGESYDQATNTNKLKEVDLWETSIVTFPANTAATVDQVRAQFLRERDRMDDDEIRDVLSTKRNLERFLRDSGLPKAVAIKLASAYEPDVRGDPDAELVVKLRELIARMAA